MTVALTDREQAFMFMFLMVAPVGAVMNTPGNWSLTLNEVVETPDTKRCEGRGWMEAPVKYIADMMPTLVAKRPETFPIVASTFEALTIERPELREHYDRAKQAWEASQ